MTDAVLGIFCTLVGAVLAIVGVAVLAFGGYTLAIAHGGGWWIIELFYVLIGTGLAFIGLYGGRYGLGLLREKKNPSVRDGPALTRSVRSLTRPNLSALRRDTEALPESPEQKEALSELNKLAKDVEETDRLVHELRVHEAAQRSGRRRAALLITLPMACVPLYFAISGILTGKSSITFQRGIDHIYWSSDPYLFGFVIGLTALGGFVLLYLALVPIFTGEEAPQ